MIELPLLRLPLIPLKSVLDEMYVGELIRLHVCSKKTRVLLKLLKKTEIIANLSYEEKQKLNILETLDLLRLETYNNPRGSVGCFPDNCITMTITVDSGNGIEVKIRCDYRKINRYQSCFPLIFYVNRIENILASGPKGTFELDSITVPVIIEGKHTIHTYFGKDQSNGLNVVVNYFKKFFNAQNIDYYIKGSTDSMFSHNLRTALKGMALQTIFSCEINGDDMNDDDYILILDNVKPTNRFKQYNRYQSQSDDFRQETSFSSVFFRLEPANWFTLENLIKTDCVCIHLAQSRLTNNDMCNYLKLWMTGIFPKLECLSVELQECVNLEYVFSELKNYLEIMSLSGERNSSQLYKFVRKVDDIDVIKAHKTVATISKPDTNLGENVFHFSVQ